MCKIFMKLTRFLTDLIAFLALLGLSLPVHAFQPLITDDTGTQGGDGKQLKFSFNEDREHSNGSTARTRTLPFVYTHGITDTLDIFASINYMRINSATAGVTWRFR